MKFYPSFFVFLLYLLSANFTYSQSSSFGEEPVKWTNNKSPVIGEIPEKYNNSDLIILDDKTEFYFYSSDEERLSRHLLIKINSIKGLEKFENFRLPESFDEAYDGHLYKQGRRSRIKSPFIADYQVIKFGARRFSSIKWEPVSFKLNYEKIRWIKYTGEFINDDVVNFQMQGLSVGDIVELEYEAYFNSNYGSNLFYLQSSYPKLNCEYNFIYKVNKRFEKIAFVLPVNLNDSVVSRFYSEYNDHLIYTDKIKLKNCDAVNYPSSSFEANTQPHVFADFRFYRVLHGSYPDGSTRIYDFDYYRPNNFNWVMFADTFNRYSKRYDKQFAALRKFGDRLPPIVNDSAIVPFVKALCDTLNNFRFISSNHLFYNESALYELYSGEHLLKRRIIEHTMWKVYREILFDKKVFYYVANVQDRRYGEHDMKYRAHYAYENELIAIPSKKFFIYFMPRYDGLKYHLNELPFYFEGSIAALAAKNFQDKIENKEDQSFKMMRTPKSTYKENIRTENASIRISLDSLNASLTIKESLSGQFSTILRHIYLKEAIDSTIAAVYFKKCLDKPNSSEHKIKLSSNLDVFPFRYTFNCSEKINLKDPKNVELKNWFSFPLSKTVIKERPSHDYYFDFEFTDVYNYSFDFTKPISISNLSEFKKSINNDYFVLESDIIQNSETNYLMKVKLIVKTLKLPTEHTNLLMEFVTELEKLDKLSFLISKT